MDASEIIVFAVLPFALYLLAWRMLLLPLIKSLKIEGNDKFAWMILIVFSFPAGPALFWIARPDRKTPVQPGKQQPNLTKVNIPRNASCLPKQSPRNTVLFK